MERAWNSAGGTSSSDSCGRVWLNQPRYSTTASSASKRVRVSAVAALGGAFRTTVEVDPDQAVVTSGPYKRIRHPSYAGLPLILAGLGLAIGNWPSAAACLVLPLPALAWRIHVEEAELSRVLADAYHAYHTDTARLIPGLW